MPAAPSAQWSAGVPLNGSAGGPSGSGDATVAKGDALEVPLDGVPATWWAACGELDEAAEHPAAPRQTATAAAIVPAVSQERRPEPGVSLRSDMDDTITNNTHILIRIQPVNDILIGIQCANESAIPHSHVGLARAG